MSPLKGQAKNDYQNAWMQRRRSLGIKILGGKCEACGATTALEVDHVNPDTKVSHRIWSWSWNRILRELAKCQLLCHDCHLKKTTGFTSVGEYFAGATTSLDRYEVFS